MRLFGHRFSIAALIGLTIVVINLLGALLAPAIAPYGESTPVGDVWTPPSAEYWLGLDNLGRDLVRLVKQGSGTEQEDARVPEVLATKDHGLREVHARFLDELPHSRRASSFR